MRTSGALLLALVHILEQRDGACAAQLLLLLRRTAGQRRRWTAAALAAAAAAAWPPHQQGGGGLHARCAHLTFSMCTSCLPSEEGCSITV